MKNTQPNEHKSTSNPKLIFLCSNKRSHPKVCKCIVLIFESIIAMLKCEIDYVLEHSSVPKYPTQQSNPLWFTFTGTTLSVGCRLVSVVSVGRWVGWNSLISPR